MAEDAAEAATCNRCGRKCQRGRIHPLVALRLVRTAGVRPLRRAGR